MSRYSSVQTATDIARYQYGLIIREICFSTHSADELQVIGCSLFEFSHPQSIYNVESQKLVFSRVTNFQ